MHCERVPRACDRVHMQIPPELSQQILVRSQGAVCETGACTAASSGAVRMLTRTRRVRATAQRDKKSKNDSTVPSAIVCRRTGNIRFACKLVFQEARVGGKRFRSTLHRHCDYQLRVRRRVHACTRQRGGVE